MSTDKMIGYKGFDRDWKCRGVKFEIDKTVKHDGNLKLCESGLHFCENPLDVLRYYGPATSKYAKIAASKVSTETKIEDTKRVCASLSVKAEINLSAIIDLGVQWLINKKNTTSGNSSPAATSGDSSPAATSGDYSPATTSGVYSHAATSDNYSPAATSGYYSPAATSGDYSPAATSDNYSPAATSGNYSPAATSGNYSPAATSGVYSHAATSDNYSPAATSGNSSPAATSGDYSHAATSGNSSPAATSGNNSIACAIGYNSKAKSTLGNWIVVAEYDNREKVVCVKTAKVDGKTIKADVWYEVKNNKFVEAI